MKGIWSYCVVPVIVWLCMNTLVKAQESPLVIIPAHGTNPDSTLVLAVPQVGSVLLVNGRDLVFLERSDELPSVHFPESFVVEGAAFTREGLYVKKGPGIYYCSGQPVLSIAFDTADFHFYPTTDDNLFIAAPDGDRSALYVFDCQSKDITLMARLPENVVYASGSADEAFVVAGNCIYLLSDHKVIKILDYFEPILTAVQTEAGLFFGTSSSILYYFGKDSVALVEEFGCRQLVSTDGILYVYKNDGSLVCYKTQFK